MDRDALVNRLADVAVRAGVNVQPGQSVLVDADIAHAPIARAIADLAYQAGAGYVEIAWTDVHVRRSTVEYAPLESLRTARSWVIDRFQSLDRDGGAIITLTGDPEPGLMRHLDPARLAAISVEEMAARRQIFLGGQVSWTIVAAPNVGWAQQVFGEPDVERLWEAIAIAMRLDTPDPVAAWRDRDAQLSARAKSLDALQLNTLRYRSAGTDLTVGLPPAAKWTGGGIVSASGVAYMPNIPTEEVFTSPDRRVADGTISLTKPLVMRTGGVVEGLKVRFDGGRIVEVTAESGGELVANELATDDGARCLGEVSLVDNDSRIAKAGLLFHNTLFDENAACHVAWGQSFPFSVEGGLAMSSDERFALGLNNSAVHTDVVIGGEGMTVTGTGPQGTVVIIKDDEWVL